MEKERVRALANLRKFAEGEKGIDEFTDKEVEEMSRHNHPYMSRVSKKGSETFAVSILNIRDDYIAKYMTTSLIGYLGQCIEEYGVPKGEYPEETHLMNEEELFTKFIEENLVDGKPSLRVYGNYDAGGGEGHAVTETTRNKLKRYLMAEFMRELFVFNPNRHIRSAHEAPGKEEAMEADRLRALGVKPSEIGLRKPLKRKEHRKKRERSQVGKVDQYAINKLHENKNSKAEMPREEVEKLLIQQKFSNQQEFIRLTEMIPPADLFERFRIYRNVHHPAIKEAVHTLYRERPDWDFSINIHESFRGELQQQQAKEWLDKNESMITTGVSFITKGEWTILASSSENRQRMTFGTKKTRVLQDMIEQHEKDARLGEEIKEKRRKDDRKLNEEQTGKKASKVKKFGKEMGNEAIREITEKERAQIDAEGEDMRGRSCEVANKYGVIQMDEIHLNPKQNTAHINHLFLESEAPNPEFSGVIGKEGEGE